MSGLPVATMFRVDGAWSPLKVAAQILLNARGNAFVVGNVSVTKFVTARHLLASNWRGHGAKSAGKRFVVVGLILLKHFPNPRAISPDFVRISDGASFGTFVFHVDSIGYLVAVVKGFCEVQTIFPSRNTATSLPAFTSFWANAIAASRAARASRELKSISDRLVLTV